MQIVIFSVIIALISAFIILLITKLGFREYVVINAPIAKLSELFGCDFCLSFWTGLVITLSIVVVSGDYSLLLCAITTPPITRNLI